MAINFITNQLAIGGLEDVQSEEALREQGIDFVLSLAPDVALNGIRQEFVRISDREALPDEAIERAVHLIEKEIVLGRRVLIHCNKGISRSPAIAICYLTQCLEMSVPKALALVRRMRPQAMPHPALLGSVVDYYQSDWPTGSFRPMGPGTVMRVHSL